MINHDTDEAKPCRCKETSWLRKHGVPIPSEHSCEYVRQRVALIPLAEQHASRAVGSRSADGWGAAFADAMEQLVRDRLYAREARAR